MKIRELPAYVVVFFCCVCVDYSALARMNIGLMYIVGITMYIDIYIYTDMNCIRAHANLENLQADDVANFLDLYRILLQSPA